MQHAEKRPAGIRTHRAALVATSASRPRTSTKLRRPELAVGQRPIRRVWKPASASTWSTDCAPARVARAQGHRPARRASRTGARALLHRARAIRLPQAFRDVLKPLAVGLVFACPGPARLPPYVAGARSSASCRPKAICAPARGRCPAVRAFTGVRKSVYPCRIAGLNGAQGLSAARARLGSARGPPVRSACPLERLSTARPGAIHPLHGHLAARVDCRAPRRAATARPRASPERTRALGLRRRQRCPPRERRRRRCLGRTGVDDARADLDVRSRLVRRLACSRCPPSSRRRRWP